MSEIKKTAIIWGCVAIVITIFFITVNTSAMVLGAGFFTKLFAGVVGSAFGLTGAMIGDAIRKFAMPDAVYTDGRMGSIIKTKLFWMIGPQLIGLIIGVVLGSAIVLK